MINRDGLIQRFEFTYELSHRMLWRFIRESVASPDEVDRMSFQDLIRTANQPGLLLGDGPTWRGYRDMRTRTNHAYQAEMARTVAEAIPGFLTKPEYLSDQLLKRIA